MNQYLPTQLGLGLVGFRGPEENQSNCKPTAMFEQNLIRSTAKAAEDQYYSTGSDSHRSEPGSDSIVPDPDSI